MEFQIQINSFFEFSVELPRWYEGIQSKVGLYFIAFSENIFSLMYLMIFQKWGQPIVVR